MKSVVWLQRLYGRFRHLSWHRRRLFMEASAFLLLSRLLLMIVPFRHLARRLGRLLPSEKGSASPVLTPEHPDPSAVDVAVEIRWAITSAARHVPFKAVCLPQAMAARLMLKRRALHSIMHFGVAKGTQRPLEAHAWLEAAGVEVVGYPAIGFSEIARFV